MKIVEIRAESDFNKLGPDWDALLTRSASDTIFLTWEWMSAWWDAYGTQGNLQILLAIDGQNRLRGIAPLQRQTVRRYGQTFPLLTFIGDGSADSDYLDFIIGRGDEAPVMEAFNSYLQAELSRGMLLQFNEVPDSSSTLAYLRGLGQRHGLIWSESDVSCATVMLPRDW